MKKALLILLFQSYISGVAQDMGLPSSSAMQTTKYSDASINESSGRVTTSIPLYNYVSGRLQVPISLSYTGNGVKLIQQSNWVGTNWNLDAGGVITRVVNYLPDEKATTRYFLQNLQALGTNLDLNDYPEYPSGNIDLMADIFSFSFPGYSGSFYLDENMQPRLTINDSDLKISFLNGFQPIDNNTIIITTPDGIKYYFGGDNASEKSGAVIKSTDAIHEELFPEHFPQTDRRATTAFYLYKIENNYNDSINIDYFDDGSKTVLFYEGDELPYLDPLIWEDCGDLTTYNYLRKNTYSGIIYNRKKIKKIYSANSDLEVIFNSQIIMTNLIKPEYDDRLLNSINIFNTATQKNIKNVHLTYQSIPSPQTTYRYFLENVSLNYNANGTIDNSCEIFRMEYNDPASLPSRFSYSTDMLGYYNGQQNNSFIAQNQNAIFDSAFGNLALRESNFANASKGALTKIHYPTGGYTFFEYEAPQVRAVVDRKSSLLSYRNISDRNPINKTSDVITIGGINEMGNLQSDIVENQQMRVSLNVNVSASQGTYNQDKIILEVKDLATGITQTNTIILNHNFNSYDNVYIFDLLKDHIYTVTLKQSILNPDNTKAPLTATANCYFSGYKSFEAAGMRVKRITDFSSESEKKIKRYYYKKMWSDAAEDVSPVITYEPEIKSNRISTYCPDVSTTIHDIVFLMATPFEQFFSGTDNQTEYKFVTISYGGEFFEEGGVEKHFLIEKNKKTSLFTIPSVPLYDELNFGYHSYDNYSAQNGLLLKEIEIKNSDLISVFYKNTERIYEYGTVIEHSIDNVVPKRKQAAKWSSNVVIDAMLGTYKNYSFSTKLKSVTIKNYNGFVQVSEVGNPITEKTSYEYGVLKQPKKITSIGSNSKEIETKLYYPIPSDITLLQGLTSQENLAYQNLYAQNNINSPIQSEHYIKQQDGSHTLLATQRSLFANFNGLILPKTSLSAKGLGTFKGKSYVTQYDTHGNPLEIKEKELLIKSLIYGYRQDLVVAELVNVPYSNISVSDINAIRTLSDAVIDEISAQALQDKLNTLRTAHPNGQITTFVYDENKQLKIQTDPSGYSTTNVYDECRRLKLSKDNDGNIIKEMHYNLINNQ